MHDRTVVAPRFAGVRSIAISPVAGAGDPATLRILAYDGNAVMPYDSKLDVWCLLVHREELDEA